MKKNANITTKDAIGYILLPRIIPRTRELFTTGFGKLALWMAYIYAIVRLLPPNHPYLNPQNTGKFGIRHVVAAAANNLQFNRQNIDQIIVFTVLLAGMFMLFAQIILTIYAFIFNPAYAQITDAISFFNTAEPEKDLALNLLDRVFGVPDLFCNMDNPQKCTEYHNDVLSTDREPYHKGLHAMLQFYSLGILVVAVLIFLYYVVVIVAETATSGTPFGQRFANMWVPIRLVAAIGLLLPLSYGLNTSQYLGLYMAKWGSGLATTGWNLFNKSIADNDTVFPGNQFSDGSNPIGEKETLLALPKAPDITPVVTFMSIVKACEESYKNLNPDIAPIRPYLVKLPPAPGSARDSRTVRSMPGNYRDALDFYDNADIVIRFGHRDPNNERYENYKGYVQPTCGEIRVKTSEIPNFSDARALNAGGPAMQKYYYELIGKLYNDTDLNYISEKFICLYENAQICGNTRGQTNNNPDVTLTDTDLGLSPGSSDTAGPNAPASVETKQRLINKYQAQTRTAVENAWRNLRTYNDKIGYTKKIQDRGWGGAGIWFNKISQFNGGFIGAATSIPSVGDQGLPFVMQAVKQEKMNNDNSVMGPRMFIPTTLKDGKVKGLDETKTLIAMELGHFYKYWTEFNPDHADSDNATTGNIYKEIMNMIFGTQGLFAMREDNASIHPLAQLTALGKGLVDSAVQNVIVSTGFAFAGGGFQSLGSAAGSKAAGIISSLASSTAFIGLTAGVILFYILPFMPFLYFFFAVGEWVKGLFEAMVGLPLWALAHMRLDGEGLPGDAASNGYFLLLDILIRPITIVFGLIAAMTIFTAQVRILHMIWDLVMDNLSGVEREGTVKFVGGYFQRGVIDEFFFTVVYAIIVYMIATTSFKLIDQIPDNLMRFAGVGVKSFAETTQDSAALKDVSRYAAFGGITFGQKITQNLSSAAGGLGKSAGGTLSAIASSTKSGGPK